MTLLSDPPVDGASQPADEQSTVHDAPRSDPRTSVAQPHRRRTGPLLALVLVALVTCAGLVLYALEPMFQRRDQRHLLEQYRSEIDRASNQAQSRGGMEVPVKAPAFGAPVAILETNALQWQQVVVEGVTSTDLQTGPGHVPGTAAPGQPGNVVIVGRRAAFGGPFDRLNQLQPGDEVVFTTTQGQSVYDIESVEAQRLSTTGSATSDATSVDDLYGPTDDDRLTLVTSDSASPWNASDAVVVVGKLRGVPFAPTPQNGRVDAQTGLIGDRDAWQSGLLILGGFALTIAASIWCYRRYSAWVAYLLTVGPLLALTILAAETVSRLMPAWM